ncbi:SusC/RagA family TonB-linked outer membrane protein [Siphonobacter curvatus]|uniref:TonB-dependent receptor n=1 Tax=Siphonobacter curvatus TaxID=2094562 RepID=A0A2S7IJV8_9BACT|nr:TonB-dependent receptor [Siphonobacter curvatus]PQA56854.1 TonB-dependent receptor [Siphonobacter curvatus]
MHLKLLLSSLLYLSILLPAFTQSRSITGRVTDEKAKELPGVSVAIKGTSRGTTTDAQGDYRLAISDTGSVTLTFSSIGYQSQDILITDQAVLNITLKATEQSLDEVVVVGYGTQKKKDLTGAISTIDAKDVAGRQTVQISEALQGSIAGVSVTRSSGAPGASSNILIRGITTLGTNAPLIIVDGVPVSTIDNVNPNDVENITVLKDAASAAIYGSRGAAGVILVTTKRSKEGQTSFEYNAEYGFQKPTALPAYVNAPEYMRLFNEQATNDGSSTGPYAADYITNFDQYHREKPDVFPFANTDWQKTILTRATAPRVRHDLVFTMGTGKIKTKASLGYTKSGAFYDNYNYERYLLRVNNDLQVNSKLGITLDVTYKRTKSLSPVVNPLYEARLMPPIFDDYYSDGRYALGKDGRNPIAQLNEGGTNNEYYNQVMGRLAFNFKPIDGLTLTALVAPSFDFDRGKAFSKRITFTNLDGSPSAFSNQPRTTLNEKRQETTNITGQFLANYSKEIGSGHNVDVLAGYEELYNFGETLTASRSGFALIDFPYLNAGSQELRDNSGSASEAALRSVFGRLKYDYQNKYYIQGNLRYDQSSRFNRQHRDALFPSISGGWTISEENFLRNTPWLSFLKVRGSYGVVGNERIGNYPYQATISFSNALFYQNGVVVPLNGGGQVDYAVENISWETTRTLDAGIDAAFFKNRLSAAIDVYHKRTYDILLALDIPLYLGYERPQQNAGIMDVKGWELETSWRDRIGKVNYSIAFNISDSKSKIVDLKGTQILGSQSTFKGSEYNEWFGYRSAGLYQTAEEARQSPRLNTNVTAGDVRYVDINNDGRITPDDRVLLGGSLPRFLYGSTIRLDYQGFDLGLVVQGVGKKLSRLPDEIVRPFGEAFGNVPQEIVGKFWSKTNAAEVNARARYPRLSTQSLAANYEASDFWLINGSYFRVKNITLGYTLKGDVLKKLGLQSTRLYVSANDVLRIHHFPRYADPEAANSSYPIVTTFLGGITLRF